MKKIYNLLFILLVIFAASCSKDNDSGSAPLRDFAEQYAKDLDTIDEFIDTHFMTVSADYDVTFTKITTATPGTSIRLQTDYPLDFKIVTDEDNDIDYKVYFIKLREGGNKRPSEVDSVHVSYKGNLINLNQFDYAQNPLWFPLTSTIKGWSEIMPLFKTGFYSTGGGPDPVVFTDYGAGVMFVPSALGYYGQARTNIPIYSPLIFSFKLFELQYNDHDRDGILSKDEVAVAGDNPVDYDTDGDGAPNFVDVDDDGDHILTRNEIHKDGLGNIIFEDCDGDTIPNYLDADSNGQTCN
jgi:FKBP-type peptidyl-prolyl cis-trans isomerase FkpA